MQQVAKKLNMFNFVQ